MGLDPVLVRHNDGQSILQRLFLTPPFGFALFYLRGVSTTRTLDAVNFTKDVFAVYFDSAFRAILMFIDWPNGKPALPETSLCK